MINILTYRAISEKKVLENSFQCKATISALYYQSLNLASVDVLSFVERIRVDLILTLPIKEWAYETAVLTKAQIMIPDNAAMTSVRTNTGQP